MGTDYVVELLGVCSSDILDIVNILQASLNLERHGPRLNQTLKVIELSKILQ